MTVLKSAAFFECRGGGMADAEDSKSSVGNHVRVQVPPSAPQFLLTVLRFVAHGLWSSSSCAGIAADFGCSPKRLNWMPLKSPPSKYLEQCAETGSECQP